MSRVVRTILLVDDDERITRALARSLTGNRTVFTAQDSPSAVELARTHRPDLVVVDLLLGTASGLDVIPALRHELPDRVIVLISAYLSLDIAVMAAKAGADFVMTKPVYGMELLRRVEEGVANEEVPTPSLAQVESEHIARVLRDSGGNISETARRLGLHRSSLQRKLRKRVRA
jgi:two-component system, response regulator RegA